MSCSLRIASSIGSKAVRRAVCRSFMVNPCGCVGLFVWYRVMSLLVLVCVSWIEDSVDWRVAAFTFISLRRRSDCELRLVSMLVAMALVPSCILLAIVARVVFVRVVVCLNWSFNVVCSLAMVGDSWISFLPFAWVVIVDSFRVVVSSLSRRSLRRLWRRMRSLVFDAIVAMWLVWDAVRWVVCGVWCVDDAPLFVCRVRGGWGWWW